VTGERLKTGARTAIRLLLAALLLATATGKLLDLRGFAAVLGTYRALPESTLQPLAVLIPLLEAALAGWLLTGRSLRSAAIASAAMHAAYGTWAGVTLARGISVPNCGCFGVFLSRPLTWGTVLEDGLMVAASLGLAGLARPPA
jgi:hypothetical protein